MCSSLSQVALASLQRWTGYSNRRMENGLQIRNNGRCVVCDCCSGEPRICGHGWAAQQGSGGRGFARTARPIPVLPHYSARMRGAVWLGQPTILLVRGASWLRSVLGSCRLTGSDRWVGIPTDSPFVSSAATAIYRSDRNIRSLARRHLWVGASMCRNRPMGMGIDRHRRKCQRACHCGYCERLQDRDTTLCNDAPS